MSRKALSSSSSALHARPPSREKVYSRIRGTIYEAGAVRKRSGELGESQPKKRGPFAVREFEGERKKGRQQSEGLKLYTTMPRVLFARKYLKFPPPPNAIGQE